MLLFSWICLGCFTGIVAGQMYRSRAGIATSAIVGVIGAVGGGWLFGLWTPPGLSDDVLSRSTVAAAIGAVLVLFAYNAAGRRFGQAHP